MGSGCPPGEWLPSGALRGRRPSSRGRVPFIMGGGCLHGEWLPFMGSVPSGAAATLQGGGCLPGQRLPSGVLQPNGTTHVEGRPAPRLVAHCAGTRLATPLPIRERGFVAGVDGGWRGPSPPPPAPHPKRGGGSAVARLRATTLVGGTARIAALPSLHFVPPPIILCVSCSVPIRHFVARRLCISAATPVPYGTRSTPNWALYACHTAFCRVI